MIPHFGAQELLVALALVLLGAKKVPEMARGLGRICDEGKTMRTRNRIRQQGCVALLLLAAAIAFSSPAGAQGTPPPAPTTIPVGALLSLTGTWSSLGLDSQAALQIAAQNVNAELARRGVD